MLRKPTAVLHLVNLSDHSVDHFSFEWTENNGLVLDWIKDKPSAWLDHTCSNVVNSGDGNDETISEETGNEKINSVFLL